MSTSRISNSMIVIGSILASLFIIHSKVKSFDDLVPSGDQLGNIISIENITKTGIPYLNPLPDNANYSPMSPKEIYWSYIVEAYYRTPFFLATQWIPINWGKASSLSLLYVAALLLLLGLAFGRQMQNMVISLSFLTVLLAFSDRVAYTFHYIRYYNFSVISIVVCFVYCTLKFASLKTFNLKCAIQLLAVAFIPTVFHQLNLLLLFYWTIAVTFLVVKERQDRLLTLLRQPRVYLPLAALAAAFFLTIFFNQRYVIFNDAPLLFIPRFMTTQFGTDFFHYLPAFALTGCGVLLRDRLPTEARQLLIHSLLLCFFFLLVFSIVAGESMLQNVRRYSLLFHVILLFVLATSLHALWQTVMDKVKLATGFGVVTFAALAGIFYLTFPLNTWEHYYYLGQVRKDELSKVRDLIESDPQSVYLSDDSMFGFVYFPQHQSFILRNGRVNLSNIHSRKENDPYLRNIYGEVYVGDQESFCTMLSTRKHSLFVFHRIKEKNIHKNLRAKLEHFEPFVNNDLFWKIQGIDLFNTACL